jgi:hypothetical protein
MSNKVKRTLIFCVIGIVFISCLLMARRYLHPDARRKQQVELTAPRPSEQTPSILTNSKSPLMVVDRILRQRRAEAAAQSLNVPLDFWGIVLDQDGNPIDGVTLIATSVKWRMVGLNPTSDPATNQVITDATGRFAFKGIIGSSLVFREISKSGFKLATNTRTGFDYVGSELFRGDPSRPEVFRMWKLRGAERTIVHDRNHRIPYDGTPVFISLTTGAISTSRVDAAHLKVSLLREPRQVKLGSKELYNWEASIEAIQGGVILSDDVFMYLAPENGYQPHVQVGQK